MKTTPYQELGCHQVSVLVFQLCLSPLLYFFFFFFWSLFKLISLKEDRNTHMSPVLHLVISITTKPENFENFKEKSLLDLNLFLTQSTMNRELESGKDIEGPSENKGFPCCTRRRQWHRIPVLLPGKSHGWRSLVGCSPWGFKQSDTTERLHFHFSLSCVGEGKCNPLQHSCLENPRDGRTWWPAVYGVTQSRT